MLPRPHPSCALASADARGSHMNSASPAWQEQQQYQGQEGVMGRNTAASSSRYECTMAWNCVLSVCVSASASLIGLCRAFQVFSLNLCITPSDFPLLALHAASLTSGAARVVSSSRAASPLSLWCTVCSQTSDLYSYIPLHHILAR